MSFYHRLRSLFSESYFNSYAKDHIQKFLSGADLGGFGVADQEAALRYSAFFGCARVLAETFALAPANEYKRLPNGDREQTDDTGLYSVLHLAPNDEMSVFNFSEMLVYQLCLGGNFLAERLTSGRRIVGLQPIEWQRYEIKRDRDNRKIKYSVLNDNGDKVELYRPDVLHVPGPSTDGIHGMSVLEYAASAIQQGSGYEDFTKQFYKNGMTPSGVFEHPGVLKPEAFNRLKEGLRDNYAGLKNSGTPMLLENGLTFKQLTIKPIDAELLSSKKFQVEDICRFFRVQPHLVQHLEKSTNNNIEQQSLEFLMYTMLPYFKRVESAINSQLLTPKQRSQGYYIEHNLAALLRGDQKSMAESFATGIQNGYYSPNDVRRMLNLNAIPNGDTYLQPLNMVPLGTQQQAVDSNGQAQQIVNRIFDEASTKGTI